MVMTKLACCIALLVACSGGNDRPDPNAPPTNTLALEEWKNTMTLADFHTAGMAVAWSTMKTTDSKLCTMCHTEYGSADEAYFFSQVVQDQEILVRFFSVTNGKISVNSTSFNAAATHTNPAPSDHPPFDPASAIGVKALQQFYTLTCAHLPALCG